MAGGPHVESEGHSVGPPGGAVPKAGTEGVLNT